MIVAIVECSKLHTHTHTHTKTRAGAKRRGELGGHTGKAVSTVDALTRCTGQLTHTHTHTEVKVIVIVISSDSR